MKLKNRMFLIGLGILLIGGIMGFYYIYRKAVNYQNKCNYSYSWENTVDIF